MCLNNHRAWETLRMCLSALLHFILMTTLWGWYSYDLSPPFHICRTNEKSFTSGRIGIWTRVISHLSVELWLLGLTGLIAVCLPPEVGRPPSHVCVHMCVCTHVCMHYPLSFLHLTFAEHLRFASTVLGPWDTPGDKINRESCLTMLRF